MTSAPWRDVPRCSTVAGTTQHWPGPGSRVRFRNATQPDAQGRDLRGAEILTKKFEVLSDGVCDACVLMFRERARDETAQSAEWTSRQMRKCEGGVREISRLLDGHQYCANGWFGMADIAVGSLLGWLDVRCAELPWRNQHPNLADLQDRLEERPSFKNAVPYAQTIRDKVV